MKLELVNGYKENKHVIDKFIHDFRIDKTNVMLGNYDCDNIAELFPRNVSWNSRANIEGIDFWYIVSCFYTFTLARHAKGVIRDRAKELFLQLTCKKCTYIASNEAIKKMNKTFEKYHGII